jgi:hypothetical protein
MNQQYNIVLLILGVTLLLLGISGTIKIKSSEFGSKNIVIRLLLSAVGIFLIIVFLSVLGII